MNSGSLNSILVIIPVLNEESTIATVVHTLQSHGITRIRVIDNGSTDQSVDQATDAGAEVICEPNLGYGQACWRGLQDLPTEVDWILFCDGDGSDDLAQLPTFLEHRNRYDLILGDRSATAVGRASLMPAQRFGNQLATRLIQWGWGHPYHDLGPLRLIRRSALDLLDLQDRGFGWTVEMQVRAVEADLRIYECPVGYRARQGGVSKISGTVVGSVKAGATILTSLGHLYGQRVARSLPQLPYALFLSTLLILMGCLLIQPHGDFRDVDAVPHLWKGIGLMGAGYALTWWVRSIPITWFWTVAILSRLILLFMDPGNDVWRYLWEGYIQHLGFSPYHFAPNAPILEPFRTQWWAQINLPEISAIYPPITQIAFRFLSGITPQVWLFKLAFIGADLWTCRLLLRRFGAAATLDYAWNPIILYSFAGGAHYDSLFLLPLVAAWLWFDQPTGQGKVIPMHKPRRHYWVSALLLGVSVAVKWMSLPILSFLVWQGFRKVGWGLAIIVTLCGLMPLVVSAIPYCDGGHCPLIPTESVFVSHGRSAEFLPYWMAKVWDFSRWHNWVHLFPLGVVGLWLLVRSRRFSLFAEGYFGSLLILSPIVHAWYFTWLVPFAVASRNWGTRWVSLSAFVYFALPYRAAQGNMDWLLTEPERWLLWSPFIAGWFWTIRQRFVESRKSLKVSKALSC